MAPPSNGATWKVARAWWPWLVVLVLDAKDALYDQTTNSFERLSMSFEGWGGSFEERKSDFSQKTSSWIQTHNTAEDDRFYYEHVTDRNGRIVFHVQHIPLYLLCHPVFVFFICSDVTVLTASLVSTTKRKHFDSKR